MRSSRKRPSPVVSSSSETAGAVSRDTSARARPSSVTTRAAWRCWPITGTTRAGAIHHAVATSWAEANESAASANELAAVTSSPARRVARPDRAASTPEPASERISTSPNPKPTRTSAATPATAAPATTNGRRADERLAARAETTAGSGARKAMSDGTPNASVGGRRSRAWAASTPTRAPTGWRRRRSNWAATATTRPTAPATAHAAGGPASRAAPAMTGQVQRRALAQARPTPKAYRAR